MMTLNKTILTFATASLIGASAQAGLIVSNVSGTSAIKSNADIVNPGSVVIAANLGSDTADVSVTTTAGAIIFKHKNNDVNFTVQNQGEFYADNFFVDNNPASGVVTGDDGVDSAGSPGNDTDFHRVLDSFKQRGGTRGNMTFFNLTPGTTYTLQLFVSDDRVAVTGGTYVIIDDAGTGVANVVIDTTDKFSSGFVTLNFVLTEGDTSFGINFDNIVLNAAVISTAVPEPGSLALVGLGGVLIASRRRRS